MILDFLTVLMYNKCKAKSDDLRCNNVYIKIADRLEKDISPAKRVIPRAKRIIRNCSAYVLQGRGHMHFLTDSEKQMIIDFLKR